MKPRIQLFLLLSCGLLWCVAYGLMPERHPWDDTIGPEEIVSNISRALIAVFCFAFGLAILSPLAVTYLFLSLRRLTDLFVEHT